MMMSFLMTTHCPAEEIYIEDGSVSGYVEMDDDGYIEGFVEDLNGKSYFIEGEAFNGVVDDGFNFYDTYPEETDFFDQTPEFENDEDFFEQNYEINLEEE